MKKLNKDVAKDILGYSIWFGLLTGLVEAIGLFFLYRADWLIYRLSNRGIWYETFWVAPLVDLVLFSLLGVGFILIGYVFPGVPVKRLLYPSFIFLALFDWLFVVLYGRISMYALLLLAVGVAVQLTYTLNRFESAVSKLVHRSLPWLAGLAIGLFVVIQAGGKANEIIRTSKLPVAGQELPNVIVIVVDALRADHLSSYGYERDTSPYIDTLVKEGVHFENAISTSSWTEPSHASMLTGHYTYTHQAELKPLDNRLPTIGEALQAEGYRTGAFSANTLFFTRRQGFGRGFLHFEDHFRSLQDVFMNSSYGFLFDYYVLRKGLDYEGVPGRRYAADINRSILRWVDENHEHPFFVFVNYFDVHDPYLPPEPYRSRYAAVPEPGGLINTYLERYYPELTPEQLQSEMDAYDGAINYVDDQIKDLSSELRKRGLMDNTLIIITADHGESFGEHGFLRHSGSLYMEQIHVPLIFWWPGHVPSDKTVAIPVTNSAIPSTILSLLDVDNNVFPSPALSTLFFDQNIPTEWPYPISELAKSTGSVPQEPSYNGNLKSVVTSDYQYIVHDKFGNELYNWQEDPSESHNLAADPATTTVLDSIKSYLEKLVGSPMFKDP
jgi:arylsulfatase A-like enzyme